METATLPPSVQAQVDAANAALANAAAPQEHAPDAAAPEVIDFPPEQTVAEVKEPAAPPHDETAEQLRKLEAKFNTLEGKYKAEVPRLQSEVAERDSIIGQLTERLSQQPTVEAPTTPAVDYAGLEDSFSAELVGMVKTVAGDVANQLFAKLSGELRSEAEAFFSRVDRAEKTSAQTSEDLFFRDVRAAVADFDSKNADPEFIGWLGGIEPASGFTYAQMLQNAAVARDVKRVSHIFDLFWGAAPAQTQEQPTPDLKAEEATVTPRRGNASLPKAAEVVVWTDAKIGKFYADVQRGVYRGKDAERDRIEADIFAARREGRYTPR